MNPLLTTLQQIFPHNEQVALPHRDKVAYCLEALWFLLFPDHRRSSKYFLAGVFKEGLDSVLTSCQSELHLQIQRALAHHEDKKNRAPKNSR